MSAAAPPLPPPPSTNPPSKKGKGHFRGKGGGRTTASAVSDGTGGHSQLPPREKRLFFKLIVRKLPAKGFTEENFVECVEKLCDSLKIETSSLRIDHFTEGRLSRAHGPLPGVGILCTQDEDVLRKVLTSCPANTPFLADEAELHQPDVLFAGFQKVFKIGVGRPDKFVGTYESDPQYVKFIEELNAPPPPKQLVEHKDDPIAQELKRKKLLYDAKNVPLLAYLKEKAEKQMIEKRKLKLLNAASGKRVGKGDKGSGKADSEKSWRVVKEKGGGSASSNSSSKMVHSKKPASSTTSEGQGSKDKRERRSKKGSEKKDGAPTPPTPPTPPHPVSRPSNSSSGSAPNLNPNSSGSIKLMKRQPQTPLGQA